MHLHSVSIRHTPDFVRVVGKLEHGSPRQYSELYFQFPAAYADYVSDSSDAFAVGMLVPAMVRGEPLRIDPPVSGALAFNLPRIRDIFHTWYPNLHRIEIQADAAPEVNHHEPRANRAATFFSGGVDSFYTLLKYRGHGALPAPLTHAIFMRGIERKLSHGVGVEDSQRQAQEATARLGVELIVGESNVRDQLPNSFWESHFFGSALSATALSLSRGFGYVCIPSSFSYHHPMPHGSTPLVDERYTTAGLQIVHDGAEARRPEKVARIVEWNQHVALRYLRVCIRNSGGAFNCGECYKCVRTVIPLRSLGVLGAARTFRTAPIDRLANIVARDHIEFVEENLAFAESLGDRQTAAWLGGLLRRKRRRDSLRQFLELTPFGTLVPAVRRARAWLG